MGFLRPASVAASWAFALGCAVGSGAPPPDALDTLDPGAAGRDASWGEADVPDARAVRTEGREGGSPSSSPPPPSLDDGGGVAASDASVTDGAAAADAPIDEGAAPPGPSGLLYSFPFDGDLTDASGHGNHGTGSAVQFVAGRSGDPGRAARFDGATSWMSAPGALLPLMARERTVTAWVRPASSPPLGLYGNALVSWGSGDCVGQMWGLGDVSDAVLVWTGCTDQQTHAALPRDTWTFVALRFTAPTTVRVWTGATSVDVTLPLAPSTSASLLWIGAETTTNSSADIRRHFAGDIDSVRIYGRALGDAEVAAVSALP